MNVDIGWWARDAEGKRLQMNVRVFGGRITWLCKTGRHEPWQEYGTPSDEDWNILIEAAGRRVPRRTIHPKIMALIRRRGR